MSGYGEYIDAQTVRFERVLPAPIDRVWEFLTKAELLASWIADGDIVERVGAKIYLDQDTDRVPFRMKGAKIEGTVLRVERPRLLEYSWVVEHVGKKLESVVTFELAPQGDSKTRLAITHRPILEGFFALTGSGWHTHLDTLTARLKGDEPAPLMQRFQAVLPRYRELAKPYEDKPAFDPTAGERKAASGA